MNDSGLYERNNNTFEEFILSWNQTIDDRGITDLIMDRVSTVEFVIKQLIYLFLSLNRQSNEYSDQ